MHQDKLSPWSSESTREDADDEANAGWGLGLGFRVCRKTAHKGKYIFATVSMHVHRSMTIGRWSLIVEGSCFLLSHPIPFEAAKPPNRFLLGFNPELVPYAFFLTSRSLMQQEAGIRAKQGKGRAGQGR